MSNYFLKYYGHLVNRLSDESHRLYMKYVDLGRWFMRDSQSISQKLVVSNRRKRDLEYCAQQIDAITKLVSELESLYISNSFVANKMCEAINEIGGDSSFPISTSTSYDDLGILKSLIFSVSTEAEQRRYGCLRKDRNQSKGLSGNLLNWISWILTCSSLHQENEKLIKKLEHHLVLLERLRNAAAIDNYKLNEACNKSFVSYYLYMAPTPTLNEIVGGHQYEEDWPFTVGILVADYGQQIAREYILNYVDVFNQDSDKYIEFYIPGYKKITGDAPFDFAIEDIKYKFDRDLFNETIIQLRVLYGIEYSFCPILILQEFENGHFTERRIVIELNTEKAGLLFEEIFSIARREVNIKEFSKELKRIQLKKILPKIIKEYIKKITGSPIIEVVMDHTDTLIQYNITDKKE